MEWSAEATVGLAGIVSTAGVAVFTQVWHARREDRRTKEAHAREDHSRWAEERRALYARFLDSELALRAALFWRESSEEERRKADDALNNSLHDIELMCPRVIVDACLDLVLTYDVVTRWKDEAKRSTDYVSTLSRRLDAVTEAMRKDLRVDHD